METYNFDRQSVTSRENGKIKSIKPLYNAENDKYNQFVLMYEKLSKLSKQFPQDKIVVEIQNVPDNQYELMVDEWGIGEQFTNHVNKFYLQVGVNAVIVVHKTY